ncbi:cytochrome P450 [Hymenopellis radicata]|nr:cytochrome P450 [Hymenopellis radicata]
MSSTTLLLAFASVAALYALYKRYTRFSLSKIPGPKSDSFLFGNFKEYARSEAGEADFKWQSMYGDVVRINSPFGGERLLVSDPKALHYAWQQAGSSFDKPPARVALSEMALGPGLINVVGNIHKRQRKVMMPGFGSTEAKAAFPIFSKHAAKLMAKWGDMFSNEASETIAVDIPYWLSRATLDAIGEVAFDYQLGALDHKDNELTKGYFSLVFDLFNAQTPKDVLLINLLDTLPRTIARFLLAQLPNSRLQRGRDTGTASTNIARQLVAEKYAALLDGKPSKDIMSILVKANANADKSTGLTDVELLAQMNTILVAGHETTSNTLTFTLLELAKNKDIQNKLRAEIREHRRKIYAQGRTEFTPADIDSMPYLAAVAKETLRFHPVVYNQFRMADKDEVLPLHRPITTKTGEVLDQLPVKKGTILIASIAGYNRHTDVFGLDASTYNPDRWLKKDSKYSGVLPGVYANVFTFGGGGRSCIGWRFAIMEIHAFLIELVKDSEYSLSPDIDPSRIRREPCFAMCPTLKGEEDKGSQLKMTVTMVPEDDD